MKWSNTYKPYTLENALAQIAVGAVLMIGYTIVDSIRWKRQRAQLKTYATSGLVREV